MLLPLLLAAAHAQGADQPWRTIRTEHFRVHYPLAAEPWTLDAVARLEAWHARVVEEVGYTPPRPIRVLVVDPWSESNGATLPFVGSPRIVLYTTPAEASSEIGHYRDPTEDLVVHEDAHVAHLVRPARNGLERLLEDLTGLGPVVTKSPAWVIEGYATVVEARVTGFGRPNGDLRALLLRRLAQEGKLPSYAALDGADAFFGGAYRYLVGSAFLEWLEAGAGEGSLRALWARTTSRELRSFDEAFRGVFGDAPDVLYGRFAAEVTADAVAIARATPPAADELFQPIGWFAGPPAISPDGRRVAVPTRPRRGQPELVVFSTAVDHDAVEERGRHNADVLRRDPEDVAPVPPLSPPHHRDEERRSFVTLPRDPRWLRDGSALVFAAATRDLDGRRRYDLYRWAPGRHRTERLTRGADLRSPDPSPDGTWAVAVQSRWGRTALVRVDLATGDWSPLGVAPPDAIVDTPRLAPDGEHLAWLENRGEGFGVVVLDLADGTRFATSPGPGGAEAVHLSWSGDALYASVGDDGSVEVDELWKAGAAGRGRLTSTPGGALYADVGPDATYAWYLSLGPGGLDLHRAALGEPLGALPDVGASPVRRPPVPAVPSVATAAVVGEGRPYGTGPLSLAPFLGGSYGTAGGDGQVELGLRVGDPVGRGEGLAIAALRPGPGEPETGHDAPPAGALGGRVVVTWKGLPVALSADAWTADDPRLGYDRAGLLVAGRRALTGSSSRVDATLGGLAEAPRGADAGGTRLLARAVVDAGWGEPARELVGAGFVAGGTAGDTAGRGWTEGDGIAFLRLGRTVPLVAWYGAGASTGDGPLDGFALGGVPTSVIPSLASAWRVADPAFAPAVATGAFHDDVGATFGSPLALSAERHRIGDALGAEGFSAIGLRSRTAFEAQPLVRVPAGRVEAGVACRIETPGLGFDPRPCREWTDWAAWAAVTWGR